jgi:hypothetical protein
MKPIIWTLVTTLAITAGASTIPLASAIAAEAGDGIRTLSAESQTVDRRRRETCWRTNRSTGQKFRIC